MTNKQPEQDQLQAQPEPQQRRRAAARKPGRDMNDISRIGEDVEDVPEFLISIPAHNDVRRFVKHNYGGGDYLVENRVGGQFKAKWELHIESSSDNTDDDSADESLLVNSSVESSPLSDDFESRIAEITARAVVTALETTERMRATQSAPPQPDPFAFVERSLEIEEKIRARAVRNNPPPAEVKDSSEQFIDMLDRFTTIAERIAPIRESDREGSGGLASVIRELAPHVKSLLPMLPSLLPQAAQAQSTAQAAPNSQPQAAAQVDPVAQTLALLINDLRRNKRVGRAADAIEELLAKSPQLAEQFRPLLEAPAPALLQQLSMAAGEDLTEYGHAVSFIEELQAELSPDEMIDEGEQVIVPESDSAKSNGNGAVAR